MQGRYEGTCRIAYAYFALDFLYPKSDIIHLYLLPAGHAARPRRGYFFLAPSMSSPAPSDSAQLPRAIAFVDGQNLFFSAMEVFGYTYPNYDVKALAAYICKANSWKVEEVRFYSGVPEAVHDLFWSNFWGKKKLAMLRAGIKVETRKLKYRHKKFRLSGDVEFHLPDGRDLPAGTKLYDDKGREIPSNTELSLWVGEEKGIDIRLALDAIRLALENRYDVALIFSQEN